MRQLALAAIVMTGCSYGGVLVKLGTSAGHVDAMCYQRSRQVDPPFESFGFFYSGDLTDHVQTEVLLYTDSAGNESVTPFPGLRDTTPFTVQLEDSLLAVRDCKRMYALLGLE